MARDVMPLFGAQVRLQHVPQPYTFYISFIVSILKVGIMSYALFAFRASNPTTLFQWYLVPQNEHILTMPGISLIFNKCLLNA